ncbi:helix-turn-helix domain-containing protein, partial [Burkholderia anthinoferrum]
MLARLTLGVSNGLIDEACVDAMIGHVIGQVIARPPQDTGSLHDVQRARILMVYAETNGNVSETARRLGVSRNTIYRALGQPRP